MILISTAFHDGGMIPQKYTGFGEDVSPEFRIIDIPEGTVSFALSMVDLDVPLRKCFYHWLIWNVPPVDVIPGGLPPGALIQKPFVACQGTAWGKHCYRGPKPPFFIRREHRYVYAAYALDCQLSIPENSDYKALFRAMDGHILAKARINGRFKHRR